MRVTSVNKMKILIIEDESRIAKRIERMVRAILSPQAIEINHTPTLDRGVDFLKSNPIDLLFLDLNLNGEDGFKVLEAVVSEPFQTVIISAYADKAITAFEYGVLDFIPKPFHQERLADAFTRFENKTKNESRLKYLAISKRGIKSLVMIDDIIHIKGAGVYSELICKGEVKHLHNKTLDNLELLLPEHFVRVHRSYIANMSLAKRITIEPGSKYHLELEGEIIIPIGRTKYKMIKEEWMG